MTTAHLDPIRAHLMRVLARQARTTATRCKAVGRAAGYAAPELSDNTRSAVVRVLTTA